MEKLSIFDNPRRHSHTLAPKQLDDEVRSGRKRSEARRGAGKGARDVRFGNNANVRMIW